MAKKAKKPNTDDKNGREANGRFKEGNVAATNRPNPLDKKTNDLKAAVLAAVSHADIKCIIKKQVEKARGGNNESAKIVLDRCLGRPKEVYEVGGKDGKPIQVSIVDFAKINDDTK